MKKVYKFLLKRVSNVSAPLRQIFIAVLCIASTASYAQNRTVNVFSGNPVAYKVISEKYQADLSEVVSGYQVYKIDDDAIYALARSASRSEFTLDLGYYKWDITLQRVDVRSDDYRFLVLNEKGEQFFPKGESVTYRGFANGNPDNKVLATIADGFINLTIKDEDQGTIEVEPVSWYSNSTENDYIVFNRADFNSSEIVCGSEHFLEISEEKAVGKGLSLNSATAACARFNVVLFGTSDLTSNKGGAAAAKAYLEGLFNKVQDDYKTDLDVELVLTGTVTSTSATQDPQVSRDNHDNYLAGVQSWGAAGALNQFEHDLAGIVIHGGITGCGGGNCGTVAGVATPSSVCNASKKYMWTSDLIGAYTMAHEWGHMFGVGHDNYDMGGYNMTSSCPGPQASCQCMMCAISPNSDILYDWSQRSKDMVAGFVASASCKKACGPTAPGASFSADKTDGCGSLTVQFTDNSSGQPTEWLWDFGDGSTSTEKNPSHTYSSSGTYTVKLTASNETGSDVSEKTNLITVGVGQQATSQFVGLKQKGTSGGYVTGGRWMGFDAYKAFTLVSIKVYADGPGTHILSLGTQTEQTEDREVRQIEIPGAGEHRIELNMKVEPGVHALWWSGQSTGNLWRDQTGVTGYPFTIPNLISINETYAHRFLNTELDNWYIGYDWEVRTSGCEVVSVVENIVAENLQLYPNPNNGTFTVDFGSEIGEPVDITVYNLLGDKVYNEAVSSGSIKNLDIQHLPSGTYFVTVKTSDTQKQFKVLKY